MEMKTHTYSIRTLWTGNTGAGTTSYNSYKRDHEISAPGKIAIPASSDPAFRGDPERYNPEELLVASLSGCHMLWYLHLCAVSGIVVEDYTDDATGRMVETAEGGGHFEEVILKPTVRVNPEANLQVCIELHEKAHHLCFIASSMNFPVRCEPKIVT
jgi:organic hydroperoxide reductase OsmC/OhrA